jgi:hypothetical protein
MPAATILAKIDLLDSIEVSCNGDALWRQEHFTAPT